ncbi:MAG TPA: hypothetical protein VNM37_09510 [Candidatus Dormibacteraeota bacterium]|nr:hypothetical protein [Candidatus Dormibacteraeota bacterium]
MTVGQLKKQLESLDDGLEIIVIGPVTDDDGDEAETWFRLRDVCREMDSDTAEFYAHFECVPIEESDAG